LNCIPIDGVGANAPIISTPKKMWGISTVENYLPTATLLGDNFSLSLNFIGRSIKFVEEPN